MVKQFHVCQYITAKIPVFVSQFSRYNFGAALDCIANFYANRYGVDGSLYNVDCHGSYAHELHRRSDRQRADANDEAENGVGDCQGNRWYAPA